LLRTFFFVWTNFNNSDSQTRQSFTLFSNTELRGKPDASIVRKFEWRKNFGFYMDFFSSPIYQFDRMGVVLFFVRMCNDEAVFSSRIFSSTPVSLLPSTQLKTAKTIRRRRHTSLSFVDAYNFLFAIFAILWEICTHVLVVRHPLTHSTLSPYEYYR